MPDERPIRPLILPETVDPEPAPALPLPMLPTLPQRTDLLIGVAAVSHSGRVRDQMLFDSLGWASGERVHLELLDSLVLIRRTPVGTHQLNARAQLFLPAGVRALLGIADNDRVVLVAAPAADLLIVHPYGVVTAVLNTFYQDLPGAPDGL
jgi:bifunctional DNA-binding transcriptional regulator/antitoxin component of YhaV-PrlF toxin-antitoxin module